MSRTSRRTLLYDSAARRSGTLITPLAISSQLTKVSKKNSADFNHLALVRGVPEVLTEDEMQ
jgi:hypothetical protein